MFSCRLIGLAAALLLLFGGAAGAIETEASQALLMDYDTGRLLLEKNAAQPMAPSSMSKLMTAYMVFGKLAAGDISLDEPVKISKRANDMGGSRMFVAEGTRVRVEDLLRGIVVQSGNDAAVALAERIAGTEEAFAEMMNARAQEIGLRGSHFVNATGWPDDRHVMTAWDLAVLARQIISEYPDYYPMFRERAFEWDNIVQENRNKLLWSRSINADGLKTGSTDAGGYGIVASATHKNQRLILVLNGMKSEAQREKEADRILRWGFREYENIFFFSADDEVHKASVWLGDKPSVSFVSKETIHLTLPRSVGRDLTVKVVYDEPVPAPIAKGDQVATLRIEGAGMETLEFPLIAGEDVGRLGYFDRIKAAVEYILFGISG